MLEVRHLNASFGMLPVLHDVSFKVEAGEIVTLLGSNGAGKSTILNVIQGIMKPDSGEVLFQGQPITGWAPHRVVEAGLIHIPEGHRIFPYLTVRENLFLGAYPGNNWKQRKEALARVAELFPILAERSNQQARLLSGGQQQMLCVARGLMSKPLFIMVDEPSIGLAPVVVDVLFETLGRLREMGITLLIPEQNALRALQLADRGYVIQQGQVVAQDDSSELMKSDLVKKAYLGK